MTKKKNIASKLVLVLFVLTLISCCLLGSTFARYVSGGTGSASVGIAKWDVNVDTSVTSTVTFDKLSPSMADKVDGGNRTNSTGLVKVAEITNSGDVDATVTITVGDIDFGSVTFGNGYVWQNDQVEGDGPSETQVRKLFSIALYYTTADSADRTNGIVSGNAIGTALAKGNGKFYIWAEVTWTSTDQLNGGTVFGDKVDTWVGEKVEGISYSLSYTAEQASQQPVT